MWLKTTKPVISVSDLYIIWKLNKSAFHWCVVCYDRAIFWLIYNYLKICTPRVQKNRNIEKIALKVVQMKSLAMHITNKKLWLDIFMVGNLQNIFMKHDLYLIS